MTNFLIDYKSIEDDTILIDSRFMSDPPLSDIDFKNKMGWVTQLGSGLPLINYNGPLRTNFSNLDIFVVDDM